MDKIEDVKACFECGQPAQHNHHIVPRSRGGTKTVPLCGRCHALAHHEDENMSIIRLSAESLARASVRAKEAKAGRDAFRERIVSKFLPLVQLMRAGGFTWRDVAERLNESGASRDNAGAQFNATQACAMFRGHVAAP